MLKAILVPGYHDYGKDILAYKHQLWFKYVSMELGKIGVDVIAKDYPDAYLARARYWIPHLESLGADDETILIGHSTGAIAAMKYAETHRLLGSVLGRCLCH
jgi:pimeloyl-ACP methyl ester carboxylesterase